MLRSLSQEEYDRGVAALPAAALEEDGPVIDHLDLLVLKTVGAV